MSEKKTRGHRIYAMRVTEENVRWAAAERFQRITPDYLLVFSLRRKPKRAAAITEREAGALSKGDLKWLEDCGIVLVAEAMAQKQAETGARMKEMTERLETALEEEARKAGEGTHGTESDGGPGTGSV